MAAGGLAFTAVLTYWDVRTADDQLAQSREDQEKAAQKQASLVRSWVEQQPGGLIRVLENRSTDPIFSVQLDYEWNDPKAAARLAKAHPGDSLSAIAEEQSVVGDWRKLFRDGTAGQPTYTQIALEEMFLAAKARFVGQIPPCSRVEVKPPVADVDLLFIDTQGTRWVRTDRGVLRPEEPESFNDASMAREYSEAGLLQVAPPKVTKIECDGTEKS